MPPGTVWETLGGGGDNPHELNAMVFVEFLFDSYQNILKITH